MNLIQRTVLFIGLLFSQALSADTILGIYLDYSRWTVDSDGQIASLQAPLQLNELLTTDDNGTVLSVKIEHPLPLLPNVGLSRTTITANDSILTTDSLGYREAVFIPGSTLTTDIDSMHEELIIYYELLDNWVSLDLGVNFMHVDDRVLLLDGSQNVSNRIDEYLAGLYAMVAFEFPTTNLYVQGTLSMADMSDVEVNKHQIGIGWEADWGLGFELGYRSRSSTWEDIQLASGEWDLDGYYASVRFHF
jgi:outer membrane protein